MSFKKNTDKGGDGPFKENDVAVRLASIRNLAKTAESLGPDRFREEILPDLKDHMDDEDEILLAIAEELGKAEHVDLFVGGSAHAHTLLIPLEILSKVEESSVREKAVASISTVASRIPDDRFEKHFVEMVHHMAESDWYSPKSSACGLFPIAYPRASPTWQLKLLALFKGFCTDQTPMVRRNAASSLKNLAPLVDKAHFGQIIDSFILLVPDDQDSVRLLAVENCVAIAEKLSEDDKNTIVKPVVLACGSDRSWRVRYMVANCFTQLVDSLGKNITQNDLVPVFVKLLKDSEAEVRTAASSKVSGVCKLLNRDSVVKDILPCIRLLSTDESAAVRAALASDVMGLAPLFGKEGTNQHLLDLFLQLLKDDTPEVRLNIIGKLNQVTQVLGLDQLSQHLLPAIVELAEDRQWRVRAAILEYIPLLAQQLGVEFFNEKLSTLCMSWLNDCVFSIREAATVNLKKLATHFGIPWAKQHIIPRVVEQQKHRNYLYQTPDTLHPDLECLTDTYFLTEVTRLLANAEGAKRECFRSSSSQKYRDDFGYSHLVRVVLRMKEIKVLLESDAKFSPFEVLSELYQIETMLQLVWSGRMDELALIYPDPTPTQPVRRYGADDYQQYEEDSFEEDYDYPPSRRSGSKKKNTKKSTKLKL